MTSGLRDLLRRAPRWLVIVAAVYGPVVMGVGVWLFVTSLNAHTETVSARVSTDYAGRSSYVDFKFADNSTDSEYESSGDSLFDAVERFGPGPARVTRNADNGTIDTVLFHDKRYTLGSETDNVIGGPVAALLGALGIAYAFRHRDRLRRSAPPA